MSLKKWLGVNKPAPTATTAVTTAVNTVNIPSLTFTPATLATGATTSGYQFVGNTFYNQTAYLTQQQLNTLQQQMASLAPAIQNTQQAANNATAALQKMQAYKAMNPPKFVANPYAQQSGYGGYIGGSTPEPPVFNKYVNGSDLLEEFIKYAGEHGVRKRELMELPVELFIKWLIIRACEEDNEQPNVILNLPAPKPQPRCLGCARFMHRDVHVYLPICRPQCAQRALAA